MWIIEEVNIQKLALRHMKKKRLEFSRKVKKNSNLNHSLRYLRLFSHQVDENITMYIMSKEFGKELREANEKLTLIDYSKEMNYELELVKYDQEKIFRDLEIHIDREQREHEKIFKEKYKDLFRV